MSNLKILMNGIITENPTFVLLLGMCPTLGTTSSAINGMSMGLATMFVLICSNIVISALKNVIPDLVRIPGYIVVIATFVTVVQMCMEAFVPALYASLGIIYPVDRGKLYRTRTCRGFRCEERRSPIRFRRNRYRTGLYDGSYAAGRLP